MTSEIIFRGNLLCAGAPVSDRRLGWNVLVSWIVLVGIWVTGTRGAMVKEPGSPVWTTSILRLNFGMMAYKVQKACVADGYWHHTVQFNLPPRVSNNDLNGTTARRAVGWNCTGQCLRIEGLYNATMALRIGMRRSITEMVNRIYDLLPDLWADSHRPNRPTRGLVDAIGRASSFLFGTATESDVSDLRGEVRDLKAQLESAAADAFI